MWSGIVGTLMGALFGALFAWYLSNKTQKRLLRISDIRSELEKAYGPLYSILSRRERMLKMGDEEKWVVEISSEEKKRLDEIMITYAFMFPRKIHNNWRQNRDLQAISSGYPLRSYYPKYPISAEFKDAIMEEYKRRVMKYYEETEREELKELKKIPDWAR